MEGTLDLGDIARFGRPVLGPLGKWVEGAGLAVSPARADCIIVPGAWVSASGEPSRTLVGRVEHALRVVGLSTSGHVIFTGGSVRGRAIEADVAARVAKDRGFDPARSILERSSTNTFENFRNAKRLMSSRGWSSALICTDAVHVPRCMWLARDVGIDASAAPASSDAPADRERRETLATREALAVIGYFAFWPYFRVARSLGG